MREDKNGTLKKKPAFFDEVNEFLSGKPCTKPKVVVNSSQVVIGGGTEDSEEETKGNVENVVSNFLSNSRDNNNKASKFPEPKKDACVTCTGEPSKKKHRLLEDQTMVTRNETWMPVLSAKFSGFIFANILP